MAFKVDLHCSSCNAVIHNVSVKICTFKYPYLILFMFDFFCVVFYVSVALQVSMCKLIWGKKNWSPGKTLQNTSLTNRCNEIHLEWTFFQQKSWCECIGIAWSCDVAFIIAQIGLTGIFCVLQDVEPDLAQKHKEDGFSFVFLVSE